MTQKNFWQMANRLLGWAVIGSLFALAIFMANIEIKDLDLWLHMAMGKFIVENGYVPQVDILSSTVSGRAWINHEWLFQIIVYKLFSAFGADGLTMMQVILVTLTLTVLLFLGYDRERPWVVLIPLLLVIFVFEERFSYRPDLFSLFFLSLFLFLLSKQLSRPWLPAALFLIQVIWVNMHGFFILGPLMAGLWLVGEELNRRYKRETLPQKDLARLKRSAILVAVACFLNPAGWKGALYPFKIFGGVFNESRIFFEHIGELEAPWQWNNFFGPSPYWSLKILIVISAILLILNYRRWNARDLLLWIVFLLISLSARRNVVFFAFIAFWIMVRYADALKDIFNFYIKNFTRTFKLIAGCIVSLCLIFFIFVQWEKISLNGYFDFDRYERKSELGGISLRNFPHKAADFLVENKIKGNFFNDFNSGAYLLGRTYPNIKASIDGRTELYGAKFFEEHDDIWNGNEELFSEWVKKYDFTGIFLGSVFGPIPQNFLSSLSQNKDWVLVYFDHDGVIFLKNTEENRGLIARHAVSLDERQPLKVDLDRIGLRRVEPHQQVDRAYSLASMQRYDQALAEGFEALRIWPNYQEAYKIVGYCFLKKGNIEEAFQTLRVAKLLDPSDKEVRYNLAVVYEHKKDFEKAVEQANLVLADPNGERLALILLSRVAAKTGQFELSVDFLKRLRKIPAHSDDIMKIGDIIYHKGRYSEAIEVYKQGLLTNRDLDQFHEKMEEARKNLEAP